MQTFRDGNIDIIRCVKNSFIAFAGGRDDLIKVEFFFRLIKYRVSSPLTTSNTEIIKKRISWFMLVYVSYVSLTRISRL